MNEGRLGTESACSACLQDPTSLKAQLQQLGEQQERLQERTAKARAKAQQVPKATELLVSRWTEFLRRASVATARGSQKKLQLCSLSFSTDSIVPDAACSTLLVVQQSPLFLSLLPTTRSQQQAAHMRKQRNAQEAQACRWRAQA